MKDRPIMKPAALLTVATLAITTVDDAPANVGGFSSLAYGPDGLPAISYLSNNNLKFARMAPVNPQP